MCGIAGFYGFRDDRLIKKISKELAHRGPDGEGYFLSEKTTLLSRRLAIIDVAHGDQPIYNEDKSVVIVYNGEIYNFQEFVAPLQKKGHIFKTKSDTEVVIHAYEEWGVSSFDKFNGMFAFALYDIKKDKLFLVRDHFGIKPMHYAVIDNRLIFSSEIRPILYSGLIKSAPNDKIIYRYLKYRIHDDGRETFFKNINRLLPGEYLEIKNGKHEVKRYSNLEQELLLKNKSVKEKNKTASFKNELIKAIKYRLISEVPVGTCLSGGLDSSTTVAVVNQLLKENDQEAKSVGKTQKTFSAVFPGGANDEEKYIDKLISQMNNIKSYKIYPKPEKFVEEIKDFVRSQEEPTISTGPYAQYKVMEEAQGKVTVLLDGQGSDEMMAGYLPYYFVYLRQLWGEKKRLLFFKEVFSSLDVVTKYIKEKFVKRLAVTELLNKEYSERYRAEKFEVENNNLKKRLVQDVFKNSLQSLLRYEDRNAMRFSIEGRVPFLDFNLIRHIFNLPDEEIIKNGWNKYILRKATVDLLPAIINKRRNKIGFTTPEYQWFFIIKEFVFNLFASTEFGSRKYFNQKQVLIAFQNFLDGKTGDTMIFWRLINLELWLREFFPKKVQKSIKSIKTKMIVNKKEYSRFPIKTSLFKKGDDYIKKISDEININKTKEGSYIAVVSEKVIAISQGRSYFIWEIKPSFWAELLSKFVKKTPYGIGLGSPWTMQLAINEVGLPKIFMASFVSAVTKIFGVSGNFYKIAGEVVRSIDGPTEYSLYPSNVSAKLGPKNPQQVAEKIKSKIGDKNFKGVVVIDANDIGRNVLGNSTNLPDKLIEKIMADNPMGQTREQTPIVLVNIK